MKSRVSMMVAVIASIFVSGCTAEDIVDGIKGSCNFIASKSDVIKLATKIGGTIDPIIGIAATTTQTVIDAVCAAVNQKKAAGVKQSAVRGVVVKGVFVRGRIGA